MLGPWPRRGARTRSRCKGLVRQSALVLQTQVPAAHPRRHPVLDLRDRRARSGPARNPPSSQRLGRAGTPPRGPAACNVRQPALTRADLGQDRGPQRPGVHERHGVPLVERSRTFRKIHEGAIARRQLTWPELNNEKIFSTFRSAPRAGLEPAAYCLGDRFTTARDLLECCSCGTDLVRDSPLATA